MKHPLYKHEVMVVCSQERVFPVFLALSKLVDFDLFAVVERQVEDKVQTFESSLPSVERTIEVYRDYEFQLVNDGCTGFGIASRSFEVFVAMHKEIVVYCRRLPDVLAILKSFGLKKIRKLNWVGSGGHYHVPVGAIFHELSEHMAPVPEEELKKYDRSPEAYDDFYKDIIDKLEMTERK
jgi:hypothetical protein